MRVLGIVLVLLSLPAFIGLLRAYPDRRKWAYFAVGFLPFGITIVNLDAAFVNWAGWPGYAKGLVVSLLDTLAVAIIVVNRAPFRRVPVLGILVAYTLAAALSIAFSDLWMSSSFYVFQLLRLFVVFVAVSTFVGDPTAVRWLAMGLAVAAIYECGVTIEQRLSGAIQAAGTMGHQNLLGLMLHFVTLPLLALVLGGERSKTIISGVFAALIAVALGASRGAVAFVAVGVVLLLVLSLARRTTTHKWKVVGVGVLGAAMIVPLAAQSFSGRFETRPIYAGPDGERLAFERAANEMWNDHPMGVGANQYVVTSNTDGYAARAGVIWSYGSRSANVHNMYLLAAAETGWLGLLTLIALLSVAVARGIAFAFSDRRNPRGDIVLGASVAIFVTMLHGFYEWVFFTAHAQYVFAIALGIVAGSIKETKRDKARRRRQILAAGERNFTGDVVQPAHVVQT